MKRTAAIALLLAALAVGLSGCSFFDALLRSQPEPETSAEARESISQMIDRLVAACNDVDLDAVLDCVSPSVAAPVRATLKVAGTLGGKSEAELLATVLDLLGAEEEFDPIELAQSLTAEVGTVTVDGDHATAKVTFHFLRDGQKYVGDTTATCVCIDGRWYLARLVA